MSDVASFRKRKIKATLILADTKTVFPGTNSNKLELTGLRISASVQTVAGVDTTADISIWGMSLADMNALTVAWAVLPVIRNHVVILDVDNGSGGWVQIFKGTMLEAQPDFNGMPDVAFRIQAITGYFQKINPVPPTSYKGGVPIDTVAKDLVERMGFTFISGGAKGVLSSPYLWGTLYDQLQKACNAAQADFYIQGDSILVTPRGQGRPQQPTIVLSPTSGLIGYPSYERAGLNVMCLFNPAILSGHPIEIKDSIVPSANTTWFPYAVDHLVESEKPGGSWHSLLTCTRMPVQ